MNIFVLIELLECLQHKRTLSSVAEELNRSQSYVTKKVKYYESHLGMRIYEKNSQNLLSDHGYCLLSELKPHVHKVSEILNKFMMQSEAIGIDESALTILMEETNIKSQYTDKDIYVEGTLKLIDLYKKGELKTLIISSDFEKYIGFSKKRFLANIPVTHISCSGNSDVVYAYEKGCPIRERLDKVGIEYTKIVHHSKTIQTLVNLKQGNGYVFDTNVVDSEVTVEVLDELSIDYFIYEK